MFSKTSSSNVDLAGEKSKSEVELPIQDKYPELFICPLTKRVMSSPVVDQFGCSYEKQAISKWMETHDFPPSDGSFPYTDRTLRPNIALQKLITLYNAGVKLSDHDTRSLFEVQQAEIEQLRVELAALRDLRSLSARAQENDNPSADASPKVLRRGLVHVPSLDTKQELQEHLVRACQAGDIYKVQRCLLRGADARLPDSSGIPPLAAAIWALNLKVVKTVVKKLGSKPDRAILEALAYNRKHYGEELPEFKPAEDLDLHDLASNYFSKESGRDVIFADWVVNSEGPQASFCVKITVEEGQIVIKTRAMGEWRQPIGDTKISTLSAPESRQPEGRDHITFRSMLSQYMLCISSRENVLRYLDIYIGEKDYDQSEDKSFSGRMIFDKLSEEALVKRLLQHVVRGEQEEADALLKRNTGLALRQCDIVDCSSRKFFGITALQYAVWALDWHMWKMLLTHLSPEAAASQLQTQSSVTERSGHGEYCDFVPLLQALLTYCKSQSELGWKGAVGHAQSKLPAHAVNEYCRPDRSFRPTPSFIEPHLPRVLKKDSWNGDWWSAVYNGVRLGEEVSGKSRAVHRGWAVGGPGPWEGGPPTGCVTIPTARTDYNAMLALFEVRTRQRVELMAEHSVQCAPPRVFIRK